MKAFEFDDWDAEIVGGCGCEIAADCGELYTGLLDYSSREFFVGDGVHRNGNGAREEAAQECGEPFAGIFAPDEDAVAFGDVAGGEVIGELVRGLKKIGVGPTDCAVATAPGDRDFAWRARVGLEIFEEGLTGHVRLVSLIRGGFGNGGGIQSRALGV